MNDQVLRSTDARATDWSSDLQWLPACFIWASVSMLMAVNCIAQEGAPILDRGSQWRYLDDGSDQGTAWRGAVFDDSGWKEGFAEFGFGDGDEVTLLSPGVGDSQTITFYFRKTIEVTPEALAEHYFLQIELLADDGAAVYVNGELAALSGLREGAPFDELATTAPAHEGIFVEFHVPITLLHPGTNVIAAEVHQISKISSDVSFNLRIRPISQLWDAPVVFGSSIEGLLHPLAESGDVATSALMTGPTTGPTRMIVAHPDGPRVQLVSMGGKFMDATDMDGDGVSEVLFGDLVPGQPTGRLMLMTDVGGSSEIIEISADDPYGGKTGCIADLDGDGLLDIAWTGLPEDPAAEGEVKWRRHLGGFKFGPEMVAFSLGANRGEGLINGDFNGNGLHEILIDQQTGASIAIRSIFAPMSVRHEFNTIAFQDFDDLAQVGDLSGDGRDDLLLTAGFYKGTASGRFSAVETVENVGRFPITYYQARDFDNDGDLDLLALLVEQEQLVWYRNNGHGVFPAEDAVRIVDGLVSAAVAMDGDLDGYEDIVMNGRDLLFLRRLPPGEPPVTRLTVQPEVIDTPGAVRIEWSVLGTEDVFVAPVPGQVEHSGAATVDITETTIFRLQNAEAVARVNVFRIQHSTTSFPSDPIDPPCGTTIDVDGDGAEELLWTSGSPPGAGRKLFALSPTLDGAMPARVLADWPSNASYPSAARLVNVDDDGIDDLLLTVEGQFWWARGFEALRFESPRRLLPEFAWTSEVGDLDGDGDVDAILVSEHVSLMENQAGEFTNEHLVDGLSVSPEFPDVTVAALDADHDGDLDLVLLTGEGLLLISLDGMQVEGQQWLLKYPTGWARMVSTDLDGDNLPDIAYSLGRDLTVYGFLSTNPGGVASGTNRFLGEMADTRAPDIAASDIDGDGLNDLYSATTTTWLRNLGGGKFISELRVPDDYLGSPFHHIFVDADGDGDRDYLSFRVGNLTPFWVENLSPRRAASASWPPFQITAIRVDRDSIVLEWTSNVDMPFFIEESFDMSEWSGVAPLEPPARISAQKFRASVSSTPDVRYFRIRRG